MTAVERRGRRAARDLDKLLDGWLEESGGPPTAAERRWAERKLRGGGAPKQRANTSDASSRHGGVTRYEKIAISLPARAAESVRRAVREGRSPSVSAYIAEAIEQKSSREDLIAMIEQGYEETGGPLTPAERRWANWQVGPRRGKPPPRPASLAPTSKRKRRRAR